MSQIRKRALTLVIFILLVGTTLVMAFPSSRHAVMNLLGFHRHYPGHKELTEEAAKGAGFSKKAVDILMRGSVDPDRLDWNTPEAHSQTANDENGMPTQSAEEAQAAFLNYLRMKAEQTRMMLSADKPGDALYRIAYALHAIQDLSAHEGMTNAEHAAAEDNPDYDAEKYQRAERWTVEFFDKVRAALGDDWDRLRQFDGESPTEGELDLTAISRMDRENRGRIDEVSTSGEEI
jgi:hypothetical protein